MKEKDINTEIKNSLRALNCFAFKVPDAIYNPRARFSTKKGVDIFAGVHGKFVAIETKTMKIYQAFGNQIRDDQVKILDATVKCDNRAFVFLNIRRQANSIKGHLDHKNMLIIFDWILWGDHFKKGSLKKGIIEKYGERIGIVGKNKLFDLKDFVYKVDNELPFI